MMKVRVKLKRQWTVEPSRERTYYRVEGTYHKVCEEDRSTDWLIIYYDSLDVNLGTTISVTQVDVNGLQRTLDYEATSEGLAFVS
jgi:hypothetical protein